MKKRTIIIVSTALAVSLTLTFAMPITGDTVYAAETVFVQTADLSRQDTLQATDEFIETDSVSNGEKIEQSLSDNMVTETPGSSFNAESADDTTLDTAADKATVEINDAEQTQEDSAAKASVELQEEVQEEIQAPVIDIKPTLLSVISSDAGITLKWERGNAQADEKQTYRVYRKTGSGSWETVGETSDYSYLDKTVEYGKKYTYSVRGIGGEVKLTTSDFNAGSLALVYSVSVSQTRITEVTSGIKNFHITYDKVDGANGYQIRYSLNPDMSGSVVLTVDANQTSAGVVSAEEGIYFVQVRAFKTDAKGNKTYGAWSSSKLAKYVKNDIGLSEDEIEKYVTAAMTDQAKKAILYAFARIGYPYSQTYRMSGDYYDCSSFVWYAWNSAGINLTQDDYPGTAAMECQALQYKTIKQDQLTPGSLIFFSSYSNGRYKNVTHVLMYAGDGMVVEAANSRLGVVFRKLSYTGRGTVVAYADPMIKGGWYTENGTEVVYQSGSKVTNGWAQDSNGWRYIQNGTVVKNKWIYSGSQWYYINANGYMVANGWAKDNKGWCYMNSSGKMVKSKWIYTGSNWYYINGYGYRVSNTWMQDSDGWYFLGSDGKMLKNQWLYNGGQWYYLNGSGRMVTNGWAKDSVGWCWMNGSGKITTNKWIYSNGQWYYLKSNGYMAANEWTKDSVGWCWMNGSGKITKNRWIQDGGNWYYLKSNGYMAANAWKKDSTGWCWLNSNGKQAKSQWVKDNGYWYYLNGSGYMVTGTQTIDGKKYTFDHAGRMQ